MCGRFTLTVSKAQLETFLKARYNILTEATFSLPRFNISPSNEVVSVLHDGTKHRVGQLKWGFRPKYSKTDQALEIINVKGETVFDKLIFKESIIKRRCVVLADSFYEWNQDKSDKNPYRFMSKEGLFAMAAIWQTVELTDGSKMHTVAIVTTQSNALMEGIHHRMPLMLSSEDEAVWLNNQIKDLNILKKIIKPYDANKMYFNRVSTRVNNPRNDDIEVIKTID